MGAPPRDRRLAPPKAREEGERRVWLATYHPSTASRSEASRIILTGGTQQSGVDIRLQASGIFIIRGMLFDDSGRPANGKVSRTSSEPLALPETEVQAHEGVFEFPEVPAGDWRLAAEWDRAGVKLRGTAAVLLSRHDVENVSLRLAPPFAYRGFFEPHEKTDSVRIELYPVDAPPAWAAYAKGEQGSLQFPAVYAGHYRINIFGTIPGYYLDTVLLEGRDVLGKEVLLAEGTPPIHVVFQSTTPPVSAARSKTAAAPRSSSSPRTRGCGTSASFTAPPATAPATSKSATCVPAITTRWRWTASMPPASMTFRSCAAWPAWRKESRSIPGVPPISS